MKGHVPLPGGELEYAVLEALWGLDEASARDVHVRVGEPNGLAYTTTAKVLDRLCTKGLVSRARIGKAFTYRPAVQRNRVEQARAAKAVRSLLGAEPVPALAALVDAVDAASPELLDELARVVAAKRRARRGS